MGKRLPEGWSSMSGTELSSGEGGRERSTLLFHDVDQERTFCGEELSVGELGGE